MKINLRSSAYVNGPLRGQTGYQIGFYEIGALRQAINDSGEDFYRVGAVKLPETQWEFNEIQNLINHPSIQYALIDKNKVVFVQIGNNQEWLGIFKELGYEVWGGAKTAKRLKSFHRPTLLNADFTEDECNILLIADPDDFSPYDFGIGNKDSEWTMKDIERLLDGGFVISHRLIEKAVRNIPSYLPSETKDKNEYFYNPVVRQSLIEDLLHTKAFNTRIIYDAGLLKGNAFVSKHLPEGVDVISWAGNLKPEVRYHKGIRFLAEPQTAKSRVHTDDQTMANFPMLFSRDDMESWLKEEYEKVFNSAIKDEALMNWKTIYQRSWRDKVNPEDEESQARMNYIGYQWRALGMKVTDSPWLFETLTIGAAKPLEDKIPIACAVYEQIVSESMVRMAGFTDFYVERGSIRRLNQLQVHVANDLDWIEMYASHGGCDQDDFFKLFYRTMVGGELDGQKVVIAMRSPNGFGEYTIFNYTEGDWYPKWKKADGTEEEFLPVPGRGWPQRLSEAIADGTVSYQGLPSQKIKKDNTPSEEYTREHVLSDLKASMASGTVGKFVNATMLWSSVFQKHRSVQVCSLEDAIDGYVQTNIVEDRECIDEDADIMVREVIDSGLPVDRAMWDAVNRNFARYLKQGEWVEKCEGPITNLNTLCRQYFVDFVKRVREYSQKEIKVIPLVEKLGFRMHHWARHDLNKFRQLIMNTNSQMTNEQGGHIDRQGWDFIYQTIQDKIVSFGLETDRHDYVLGLYYISLIHPTSTGKVTDQIVMNRYVFPYLREALEFYGIGKRLDVIPDSDGKLQFRQSRVRTWQGIDPETNEVLEEFHDPVLYQKYMLQRSPIVHSTAS